RAARPVGAVGADPAQARPRLLARDAPEDWDHPGAPARPGAGDPRRADRGPRPADATGVLRPPRRPESERPDDLLLVARPVRGGAGLRSRRARAAWPAGRAPGCREPARAPAAETGDP